MKYFSTKDNLTPLILVFECILNDNYIQIIDLVKITMNFTEYFVYVSTSKLDKSYPHRDLIF